MVITQQTLSPSTSEEDCYFTAHVATYDNVDGLKNGNRSDQTIKHRFIPGNYKILKNLLY